MPPEDHNTDLNHYKLEVKLEEMNLRCVSHCELAAKEQHELKKVLLDQDSGVYTRLKDIEKYIANSNKIVWILSSSVLAIIASKLWKLISSL